MTKKEKRNGFRYRKRISKQILFSVICLLMFNILTSTSTVNAQIQTGEKDTSKFYNVTSEDGIEVPVPYGFCPSNQENERYVNGKIENKTGNIVATLPTENLTNWTYEDVTINGETNKFWYNTTTDYCEIETPVFEIGENGGVIDMEWSASCDRGEQNAPRQCRVELKLMNEIGTTETKTEVIDVIQGQKLGTTLTNLEFETLKHELEKGKYKVVVVYDGGDTTTTFDKTYIKKFNTVEYSTEGSEIVENVKTKDGGFVIYEATTEELNLNTYDYNTKNYNQYVWVPVPAERLDFLYSISDDKYTVQGLSFSNSGTTVTNTVEIRAKPDLAKGFDKQVTYLKKYFRGEVRNDTLGVEQEEYKDTMESIRTYGGFYVGRYESGTGNKFCLMPVSKKGTKGQNQRWYEAYRNHKYVQDEDVITSLLWGNQWDYILRWMVSSSEISNYDINSSTSWGNVTDAWFQYLDANGKLVTKNRTSSVYIPSGLVDYSRKNGIYDLSGNLIEWNIEVHSSGRCYRGGIFNFSGDRYFAARNDNNYPYSYGAITGARISLTI